MLGSFKYAVQGIRDALKSERNLRIHFGFSVFALVMSFALKLNAVEFSVVILTIFVVVILEFINTAIEKLADIVHPEKSEKIRIVKDISAGVVLMGAIASILVGIFLFLPKILGLFI